MIKRAEQQIINDAPAILELILSEYGETNAIAEVRRLVDVAKSAMQRAEVAEEWRVRAEAAEAKLTLVERYGADQWRREELDAMRADPDLCLRYLDAVLDGMTVQELAALADVADEVRARWGLGEGVSE